MNTVAVLLLYTIGFRMFCQKEKTFVLTKCKQKIFNTKETTKKKKKKTFVL